MPTPEICIELAGKSLLEGACVGPLALIPQMCIESSRKSLLEGAGELGMEAVANPTSVGERPIEEIGVGSGSAAEMGLTILRSPSVVTSGYSGVEVGRALPVARNREKRARSVKKKSILAVAFERLALLLRNPGDEGWREYRRLKLPQIDVA